MKEDSNAELNPDRLRRKTLRDLFVNHGKGRVLRVEVDSSQDFYRKGLEKTSRCRPSASGRHAASEVMLRLDADWINQVVVIAL